jgi:hypothetical protein
MQGRLVTRGGVYDMNQEKLIETIINQVSNALNEIIKLGRQDFFEIHIKHINGELVTKLEYSDKTRIK